MRWHEHWTAGDWVWMTLLMTLLWGLVVAGIVLLVGRARPHAGTDIRHEALGPSPRQILDERYARGEMSDEEYLRRRGVLEAPR